MTTMAFVLGVAALFSLILAWEASSQDRLVALRPATLWSWLTGGNWPAKVGAGLLIIGSGALLRYVMVNVDFPPAQKLVAGVGVSALLGMGSAALRGRPQRRAIHLALGGAALGVAYLTAYSAYGFFHYVSSVEALAALFVVACGATVFAVSTGALSMAVLAMVGAFMAPAFALEQAGATPLFSYYALASLLVAAMVRLRGWRPLIHLSFLFTLAGGLFFGWTREFYLPAHHAEVQPWLLLMVAIHLALPFAEAAAQRATTTLWQRRFDTGYFLLLPLVAVMLTLTISPDFSTDGAQGVLALAGLWTLAAAAQHARWRSGSLRYLGMAALLALLALGLWAGDLPYFLLAAIAACTLLAFGRQLELSAAWHVPLAVIALACAGEYMLKSLGAPADGHSFLTRALVGDLALIVSMGAAARRLRGVEPHLSATLWAVCGSWLVVILIREALRLHLAYFGLIVYVLALGLAAAYCAALWRLTPRRGVCLLLAALVFGCGLLNAKGFAPELLLPLMVAGQLIFSAMAYMVARHGGSEDEALAAQLRSCLPLLLLPLALAWAAMPGPFDVNVVMTLLVASALFASLQAQLFDQGGPLWPNTLSPVGFLIFAAWLLFQTLCNIQRESWAIAYEVLALTYLLQTLRFMPSQDAGDARLFSAVGGLSTLSVAIAMLLRLVGPPGPMSILDIDKVLMPAAVSLLIAVVGGALAGWSKRNGSRALWLAGAALLVAAALKLVFLDFGSLGQLGNILAMMGAGAVFLFVAWWAPMPPKPERIRPAAVVPSTPRVEPAVAAPAPPVAERPPVPPQSDFVDTQPAHFASVQGAATGGAASQRVPTRFVQQEEEAEPARSKTWLWLLLGLIAVLYLHNRHSAPKPLPPGTVPIMTTTVPPPERARPHTASVAPLTPVQPVTQVDTPKPAEVLDVCSRFAASLPAEAIVLAAGQYSGRALSEVAQPSGHRLTAFEVEVDEPGRPVILALGAYEPAVWNIRLSPSTRVAGVIASGYYGAQVNGLPRDVPVLHSSYEDKTPCGHFDISAQNPQAAAGLVRTVTKRAVESVYVANNGQVRLGVGRWFDTHSQQPAPAFSSKLSTQQQPQPLMGNEALDALQRAGSMRLATEAELTAWLDRYRSRYGALPALLQRDASRRPSMRIFILLEPIELPRKLSGLNVFIVPSGMRVPVGDLNLTILSNDPPECRGMLCNRG